MSRLELIIYKEDKDYLDRFSYYVSTKYASLFTVSAYTDFDEFIKFIDKTPECIVLMEEKAYSKKISNKNLFLLSEKNACLNEKNIYIYQSIDKIVKYLIDRLDLGSPFIMRASGKENTKILTFCSASGGVGKSTISALFSRYLTFKGYKTCFLSLDPYISFNNLFEVNDSLTFSDLIFDIKKDSNTVQDSLLLNNQRDEESGVYVIAGVDSALDFCSITEKEWENIIGGYKTLVGFDYVVVDMNSKLCDVSIKWFGNSYTNFALILDDEKIRYSTDLLLSDLKRIEARTGENLTNKTFVIENKSNSSDFDANIPKISSSVRGFNFVENNEIMERFEKIYSMIPIEVV